MIFFGSATPVSKMLTDAMPVSIASGARVGLGGLALLPFVWGRLGQARLPSGADLWPLAGISVFGMFGFTVFLLTGMKLVSGVAGAIVMSATPAVTAIAAVLFLGEEPTGRKVLALVLAVAGLVILQVGGDPSSGAGAPAFPANDPLTDFLRGLEGRRPLLGIALVFAAVCCEAAYTLLGRSLSQRTDPALVACLGTTASLPLFGVLIWVQWPSFAPSAVSVGDWAAFLWFGAGTLAAGTVLWYRGTVRTEGSVAAGFMALMPVSALVLSYVLLGERFAWIHLAGFAVVFLGVLLIAKEHAES